MKRRMASHMYLWNAIYLIVVSVILEPLDVVAQEDVTVTVSSSASISDEDPITLTCSFERETTTAPLSGIYWLFTPVTGTQDIMFIYNRGQNNSGPQGRFQGRLNNEEPDTDNGTHHILFYDPSWCADLGLYGCLVNYEDTSSGQNSLYINASADLPDISVQGEGLETEDNIVFHMETPGPVDIKCTTSRNSEFSLHLVKTESSQLTKNCTHVASNEHTENFTEHDQSMTFSCVVESGGVNETAHSYVTIIVGQGTGGNGGGAPLSGGEIAGIVIGLVAILAIVVFTIYYCYKKRENSALELEKNKRDENKKNPKNNQVGDSQEDLGQDKRNKGDVNYHENPSYSSQ